MSKIENVLERVNKVMKDLRDVRLDCSQLLAENDRLRAERGLWQGQVDEQLSAELSSRDAMLAVWLYDRVMLKVWKNIWK